MLVGGEVEAAPSPGLVPVAPAPVTSTRQPATLATATDNTVVNPLPDIRTPCPVPIGCLSPAPGIRAESCAWSVPNLPQKLEALRRSPCYGANGRKHSECGQPHS